MSDVPRETSALQTYGGLLRKWNERIRLSGRALAASLSDDALHDSRVLAKYLEHADEIIDLGTGNGLPLIPALIMAEATPTVVRVVEADARKAAFLRTVRRELGLNLDILQHRIEEIPYLASSLISAKAFAPLPDLLAYAVPHLARDGVILAFKGRKADEEIAAAARTWDFDVEREGTNARTGAVLLVIRNPRRRIPA